MRCLFCVQLRFDVPHLRRDLRRRLYGGAHQLVDEILVEAGGGAGDDEGRGDLPVRAEDRRGDGHDARFLLRVADRVAVLPDLVDLAQSYRALAGQKLADHVFRKVGEKRLPCGSLGQRLDAADLDAGL